MRLNNDSTTESVSSFENHRRLSSLDGKKEKKGWMNIHIFSSEYRFKRLLAAIDENDYRKFHKIMSKKNVDIRAKDKNGWTPLFYAVSKGRKKIVDCLLRVKGADVDATENDGTTPLLCAAMYGKLNVMKLLIARGADINARNQRHWGVLHLAAGFGHVDIIEYLVQNISDEDEALERKNKDGRTPLHIACVHGQEEAVEALLKYGSDIDARNKDGLTPVIIAAASNKIEALRTLVNYGADIEAKNAVSLHAEHKGTFQRALVRALKSSRRPLYLEDHCPVQITELRKLPANKT